MNIVRPLNGSPGRPRHRSPVLAAIDLGSNNCRLLIAAPQRGGGFRVIESFSRAVRLAEGLAATGRLSDAAIERAVAALVICAERVRRHGDYRLKAIATEACRQAANVDVLLARVEAEAGITLDVIAAEDEARLAAIGCAPLLGEGFDGALVFDIGGGSTELIWIEAGEAEPVFATSVRAGVVGLAERFGPEGACDEILAAVMPGVAEIARAMGQKRAFSPERRHLLGTSGTVTTLAALALGLPRYDRDKVDGSWHDTADVLAVVDRLAALDVKGRAALGCVGTERADLVLAGCAIFRAIEAHWPCTRLRVADRGLREGMIRELMART